MKLKFTLTDFAGILSLNSFGKDTFLSETQAADIAAKANEFLEKRLSNWIEQNRFGFYGGCRVDEHSPQINEFADALQYYLKKEFE